MKSGIANTKQGLVILTTELTYEPVRVVLDPTNKMTLVSELVIATNVTDDITSQSAALLRAAAKNNKPVDVCAVSMSGAMESAYQVPIELSETT